MNKYVLIFLALFAVSTVFSKKFIVTLKSESERKSVKKSILTRSQPLSSAAGGMAGLNEKRPHIQPIRMENDFQIGEEFSAMVVDTSDDIANNVLKSIEGVADVEPDQIGYASSYLTQRNPSSWGLDRIDQRALPLNSAYSFDDSNGTNIDVYVIDTGIRISHAEFEGRASIVRTYYPSNIDEHGHGTHVASIIGGRTVGVSKRVILKGIQALDSFGLGFYSHFIDAINWVVSQARETSRRSIINMSITGGFSSALNSAINAAWAAGVIAVVCAGNWDADASLFSPASAANAITVGATTLSDERADYSNFGKSVTIHAPGSYILGAGINSDIELVMKSGTSMAAPHVAGAIAQIWSANPSLRPSKILNILIKSSTKNVIKGLNETTPNRLLFSRFR